MDLPRFPTDAREPFRALAFDYGTHRIGVAVGQSLTGTAQPLPVLTARDGVPDWTAVARLIDTWQPQRLVVGLPFNMDDTDATLKPRAEKFARRLEGRFHLPCYGIDERLTSVAAEAVVWETGTRAALDSVAAQIILESWFSTLAQQTRPGAAD